MVSINRDLETKFENVEDTLLGVVKGELVCSRGEARPRGGKYIKSKNTFLILHVNKKQKTGKNKDG